METLWRSVFAQTLQCRQMKALTCRSNLPHSVHNPRSCGFSLQTGMPDCWNRFPSRSGISSVFILRALASAAATLLRQGEFDLAIVSEKLADGPGLQLLGQIARSCPDTLRIFAARRSRLQFLKGRLGPFGLFRTLPYPIEAQKLLSALTLARAGLETEAPELTVCRVAVEERRGGGTVAARLENEALPPRPTHGGAATSRPSAVRPIVKPVSLASADALISINVPMVVAAMKRVRHPGPSRVGQPAPVARQSSGASAGLRRVQAQAVSENTSRDRATPAREQSVAPEAPGIAHQPQSVGISPTGTESASRAEPLVGTNTAAWIPVGARKPRAGVPPNAQSSVDAASRRSETLDGHARSHNCGGLPGGHPGAQPV